MDVELPKWGMTMQEGIIAEWLVQPGAKVTEGQVIARVETEKVDAELEAPINGVVEEILVNAGETVDVGTVVARIRPT